MRRLHLNSVMRGAAGTLAAVALCWPTNGVWAQAGGGGGGGASGGAGSSGGVSSGSGATSGGVGTGSASGGAGIGGAGVSGNRSGSVSDGTAGGQSNRQFQGDLNTNQPTQQGQFGQDPRFQQSQQLDPNQQGQQGFGDNNSQLGSDVRDAEQGGAIGGQRGRATLNLLQQLGLLIFTDGNGRIVIQRVTPNSPAQQIGLQNGDQIVSVGGQNAASQQQLNSVLQRETASGSRNAIPITIRRNGAMQTVSLPGLAILGSRGARTAGGWGANQNDQGGAQRSSWNSSQFGGHAAFLGVDLDSRFPNAAVIARVYPDTAAAQAGLNSGDTIWSINGQPVESSSDLSQTVSQMRPGQQITIRFTRPVPQTAQTVLGDRGTSSYQTGSSESDFNQPSGAYQGQGGMRRRTNLPAQGGFQGQGGTQGQQFQNQWNQPGANDGQFQDRSGLDRTQGGNQVNRPRGGLLRRGVNAILNQPPVPQSDRDRTSDAQSGNDRSKSDSQDRDARDSDNSRDNSQSDQDRSRDDSDGNQDQDDQSRP